ncbi:MAG: Holliday junction resolvase RuvX [Myxococcota bacterium]|jgi:putative Holliday junction resolvase|nr:Holliday junction resolvase RuvX [Myxococcota bacterium]
MRTLGIDFGEARIGLALSDASGTIAMPLETIETKDKGEQIRVVADRITEREVERVVVGLPLEMDGTAGPMAEIVEKFSAKLEATVDLTVIRWDERLTSVAAERAVREMGGRKGKKKKKKGHLDPIAACLLLQAFLDSPASR